MSNESDLKGIDKLFAYMETLYGSRFADLWGPTEIGKVKAVWEQKLAPFSEIKGCMRQALAALDDRPNPPTLPEFIALCREAARRIGNDTKRISYTPSPEEVERIKEKARQAASVSARKESGHDFKGWAKALRVQYLRGDSLTARQQCMASEAINETWMNGVCSPRIVEEEAA